jgi:hypothetical protein
MGVWHFFEKEKLHPPEFRECLEVEVSTADNIRSAQTYARAYFFDKNNKIIASELAPSKSGKRSEPKSQFAEPIFLYKGKSVRLFFEIPDGIKQSAWKAVIVFGDKNEAQAVTYPATESSFLLSYPEKQLVESKVSRLVSREVPMDPLLEDVVQTGIKQHPKITLFLRPPNGVTDGHDVKGVLAMCLLGSSVEDIRRKLQGTDPAVEVGGFLKFADKYKLAVLCWGAQVVWNPRANFDELDRASALNLDQAFDRVADAWQRGVDELCDKYALPKRNFFLMGTCAAGQWAHRLAMRKPDYFMAVYIHIPSSFDRPTPEASKILWLLTTGELDGGYEHSKRFYSACRNSGYPIIFKPIIGLKHANSPIADNLAMKFFEYALSVKTQREQYDLKLNSSRQLNPVKTEHVPWLQSFSDPPFYGDYINQDMFPKEQMKIIPEEFRVALPTKDLAAAWNK